MSLLENLFSQATIERLGWMLVHFLWQGTAVALLLAVLLRRMRRADANLRYAVACGALALMVALPLITMQLIEVSGPAAEAGPPPGIPRPAPAARAPVAVQRVDDLPPLPSITPLEVVDLTTPISGRERVVMAIETALPYAVLGWLVGVFGLSAWHLGGWAQLQRLKRRMTRRAGPVVQAALGELAARLGVQRGVTLLESALVEVPTVVGWLRPVILLPASALTGLSPDQWQAILAHELAHIRRYDYLTNILQTVAEILGFYHPAIWWVSRRIRIERENCCDDLAVRVCGNSLQYARALTSMEEIRHSRSDLALAASGGSLMARIARLLGRPAVDDRRFAWLPGLITLLLVAGVLTPLALTLGAAGLSQGQTAATDAESTPDWAKASLAALPGWEIEHLDAAPSVIVGDRKGQRLILRKGQKEYLDLEPRQRGQYSEEELRKAAFVMRYQRVEIVVLPDGESPADAQAGIGWTQWQDEPPYFKKAVHLGRGMGRDWYADATIYDQERLRQSLKLESGDDRLALLTEAMWVQDEGGMTRNSCVHLLAAEGDKAIPYIRSAVEGRENGVQAIHALAFVQTDTATEYLKQLYQAEPTRAFAEYALVHEPFRRGAKEPYLDMLRRRRYIVEATKASVQFGWKEAIPLLNAIYEQTHSIAEFGIAFHAARTLEGRPVPAQIDQAQERLQRWVYSEQPPTKEELAGAKAMLLSSTDTESAIVAAIQVAMVSYKASQDRLDPVREVGREVLRELPREETVQIIHRLAASMTQASDEWSARQLLDVLSSERGEPRHLVETVPPVPPDPMLPVPPRPTPPAARQHGSAGKTADGSAVQVMKESRAGDDAEKQDPVQILITFSLFPKVSADRVVDPETRNLLGGILAAENPRALREIIHTDPKQDVTLSEVLRTWVAEKPMTPETIGRFIDVLQSRRYLEGEARLEVMANNGEQAGIRLGSEELLLPPATPAASAEKVKLGTFVQVTPRVSSRASDRVKLEIAAQWRERAESDDPSSTPAVRTTELASTLVVPNGQYAALVTVNTGPPDGDLRMLLVGPTTIIRPQNTVGQAPDASARTIVESPSQSNTQPQDETQVLVDWVIAKVSTETVLDRETLLLIASTLAPERPQIMNETARTDRRQRTILGDVLRRYVTRQSLSQETAQALIEILQGRGLLKVQARPKMLVRDEQPFEIRNLSEQWFTIPPQNDDAGTEPVLKKVDYGTVIKGTSHLVDGGNITLEVAVTFTEPATQVSPTGLPIVRTMEVASTMTVAGGQYFSLLVDSSQEKDAEVRNPESLLVMFAPSILEPAPAPPDEPAAQAPQAEKHPRQVLLDTRVVVVERSDLLNVGVEWSLPTVRGSQPPDKTDWLKGVVIGYAPDPSSTDALVATLDQLEDKSRADIIAHPQLMTQDGRQAMLTSIQEEWYLVSNPGQMDRELQKIDSGTILRMTPHVGDHNEITLLMEVEVSTSLPHSGGSDLPVVTRRVAKNSVTIRDGGTIAVAGLAEGLVSQNKPSKEIAVFVTASLVPETLQSAQSDQTGAAPPPAIKSELRVTPGGSTPLERSAPTATDLLQALAQVSTRFGVEIAADLTVKPQPVKIDLVDAPITAALERVLEDTPYRFEVVREGGSYHYLVYRPISGEFKGVGLAEALQDIAAMSGVPILIDPNVGGQTHAWFKKVPLERALTTVLAGTPYLFKKAPHYYLVASRSDPMGRASKSGISTQEMLAARDRHVNSDPMVCELAKSIVEMERDLIVLQQTRTQAHPDIAQRKAMLKAFRDRLEERRKELEEEFDRAFLERLKSRETERNADDGQAVNDANRPSRAWTIMQQFNGPRLLQGLGPRLARLLEPEHQKDPVWQPQIGDGQLAVRIDMDEPTRVEVTIGLFEDAKWSRDPVAVRRVAGAGTHLLTGLPAGRFQIGAIAGKYAHALGVQRQWPQPVEIGPGRTASAELLVAKAATSAAGLHQQGIIWDYLGHWDEQDDNAVLHGRITGPDGRPIPFAFVAVREHNPRATSIAAPNLGTNVNGIYKFGGIQWPYTVTACWDDPLPATFGSRYQLRHLSGVFQGPQELDIRFDRFPQGTARVAGRVVDERGEPVTAFLLRVHTAPVGDDGQTTTEYGYTLPFLSEDGRFEAAGLPEGAVTASATALGSSEYEVDKGKEVVLEPGRITEIPFELPHIRFFYGRVLFEDGSPAMPEPAPWEGAKTVVRLSWTAMPGYHKTGEVDGEGYFGLSLRKQELDHLRSGQCRLEIRVPLARRGSYETTGSFPLDRLSEDKSRAGSLTIPRAHPGDPQA